MALNSDDGKVQSLISALNKFVEAVDTMDETVMIPSRLRDLDIPASTSSEINTHNNNMAILPFGTNRSDMYSFYLMLNAIKQELVSGYRNADEPTECSPKVEGSATASNTDNHSEQARKTATAFRYHIRGIFTLLKQLTGTANYLTQTYENDISNVAPPSPYSPFAL